MGSVIERVRGDALYEWQKAAFFKVQDAMGLAITFDDVREETKPGDVIVADVDISSKISRNIEVNTPIMSSPMDTVTGSDMAIAMAKLGGVGVIHTAYSIEEQRKEVRRVKFNLNGLIDKPITVETHQTIRQVKADVAKHKYPFEDFPVTDEHGHLLGTLTSDEIKYSEDDDMPVGEAMTPLEHVNMARQGTDVHEAYKIMQNDPYRRKLLPLVNSDMRLVGLYVKADVHRAVHDNPENFSIDANGQLLVGAALSTDVEQVEARIQALDQYADFYVFDTANGNSRFLRQAFKIAREMTRKDIIGGNVSSGVAAVALAKLGVDGVRDGQGGGSICTTRKETGIGTPQVKAIYDCKRALWKHGFKDVPVIADGGIRERGDISLAIAAGADVVMLGSMLAATDEAPGELIIFENGTKWKGYRGMGSPSALRDNESSRHRYGGRLPEGIEAVLPYKGRVSDIMLSYIQALKKSMEYVNAPNIRHHQKYTRLIRNTGEGARENTAHIASIAA